MHGPAPESGCHSGCPGFRGNCLQTSAASMECFMSGPWERDLSLCSPGDSGSVFPWCRIIIYNEALTQK